MHNADTSSHQGRSGASGSRNVELLQHRRQQDPDDHDDEGRHVVEAVVGIADGGDDRGERAGHQRDQQAQAEHAEEQRSTAALDGKGGGRARAR